VAHVLFPSSRCSRLPILIRMWSRWRRRRSSARNHRRIQIAEAYAWAQVVSSSAVADAVAQVGTPHDPTGR
jgi:hypothetical protein